VLHVIATTFDNIKYNTIKVYHNFFELCHSVNMTHINKLVWQQIWWDTTDDHLP